MIEIISSWSDLFGRFAQHWPNLSIALFAYPVGCLLGIYWTQCLKRSQIKSFIEMRKIAAATNIKYTEPLRYSSAQLRAFSTMISATVIGIIAKPFFHPELDQLFAHVVLGGIASPVIMWAVITVAEIRNPELALRLKLADRRKGDRSAEPPGGSERRDPNSTGEFYEP